MKTSHPRDPTQGHSAELQLLLDEADAFLARPGLMRSAGAMSARRPTGVGRRRPGSSGRTHREHGPWRPLRLRPVKLQGAGSDLVATASRRASVGSTLPVDGPRWVRRPAGRAAERSGGSTILGLLREVPNATVPRRGLARAFAQRLVIGGLAVLHAPLTGAARANHSFPSVRPVRTSHPRQMNRVPEVDHVPGARVAGRTQVAGVAHIAGVAQVGALTPPAKRADRQVPVVTHTAARTRRRAMVLAGGVAAAVVAILAISIGHRDVEKPAGEQGARGSQLVVVQTVGADGRTTKATFSAPVTMVDGQLVAIVTSSDGSTRRLPTQTELSTTTQASADSPVLTAPTTSAQIRVAGTERSSTGSIPSGSTPADQPGTATTTPVGTTAAEPSGDPGSVTADDGTATVVTGLTTLSGWILLTTPSSVGPAVHTPTTLPPTIATTPSSGPPALVPGAATTPSTTTDPAALLTACVTVPVPASLGLPTCPVG